MFAKHIKVRVEILHVTGELMRCLAVDLEAEGLDVLDVGGNSHRAIELRCQ